MIPSFISLISILFGIIGSITAGFVYKKYSLGITGNTIAGVFGSILLIKSFGRLGFDPESIMHSGKVDITLLTINIFISLFCGGLAMFLIHKLKLKMGNK